MCLIDFKMPVLSGDRVVPECVLPSVCRLCPVGVSLTDPPPITHLPPSVLVL